jgi:hypothetical protein
MAAGGVGAVGTALVALGVAAWLARLGVIRTPIWVIAAWVVAIGVAALMVHRSRREVRSLAPNALAHELERRGAFRRGALSLLLEESATGVSDQLLAAADRSQAVLLGSIGVEAIEGDQARSRGRLRLMAAVALVGGVLLGSARPVGGTASALWRPDLAWAALVAPLEIQPDRSTVERGERVEFSVRACGRRHAVLWTRAPGPSQRCTKRTKSGRRLL